MKFLTFIIVMLFVGISATLLALENPGYAMLARPPWSVEMPLTLFAVLALLAFLLGYLAIYIAVRVWRIPREVARWRQLRHARRAQEGLYQGLLCLMEGSWVKAEKRLVSDLRYNQHPLLNYLAAACAAQGEGDTEKRNQYLTRATQYAGSHELAVGMIQAHLDVLAGQPEHALASLNDVRAREPDRPQVLRLLAQVYRTLADWTNLANLIPELRKRKVLPAAELEELELQAHRELLTLSLPSGSGEVLQRAWRSVPPNLRTHPRIVDIYVRHLIKQGDMLLAESLLSDALRRGWDDNLVRLYGRVHLRDASTQLATAEMWLEQHGESPSLLLTLGRIAADAQLKTKAREYFERSLALNELPETCSELGQLLEQSGQTDKAREYYRRGLLLTVGDGPQAAAKPEPRSSAPVYELKR